MANGNDNPGRRPKLRPILADHKPARRRCLGCGAWFASGGPGNRKCPACERKRQGLSISRCEENQQGDARSTGGRE